MANVLKPERQEQVCALGRLGWSLRRIQAEAGVHRDTVRRYLTEAGIPIRDERGRRLPAVARAKPASQVTADPGGDSKPASQVFPDSDARVEVLTSAAKSACEPHRDFIAAALDPMPLTSDPALRVPSGSWLERSSWTGTARATPEPSPRETLE